MSSPSRDAYMVKFVEHGGRKSDLSLKAYKVEYVCIQAVTMYQITNLKSPLIKSELVEEP